STTCPTRPATCASAGRSRTASASAATTAPSPSGPCERFRCAACGFASGRMRSRKRRQNQHRPTTMSTSPTTTLDQSLRARSQATALTPDETKRYSRHLIMPEVGVEGQKRLKAASILLIGAGGLGSPLGLYLAAAGIGRLGLVDFDVVGFSSLQRRVRQGTPEVGRPKLQSAKDRLQAINPEVKVDLYETKLTSANALDILKPYDVIIDGTDNFPTRYLVNDACVLLRKPNVY